MFHALETTLSSSYWILYVPGQSTSWMMNDPSHCAALDSSEHEIPDVELMRAHVALVVAP
jgi:hypothetical protein